MRRLLCTLGLLASSGCFPEFDETPYLVAEPRVLAIRGVPAEAAPNTPVRYEALVASPDGRIGIATQFAYCTESRTAEERTGITASCLSGDNLVDVDAESTVPSDACARFGPNTPPSEAGEPARRPSDPDPSGGYYLPIRASVATQTGILGFGLQRIRCDLAGATRDIFQAYQERYRNNRHPDIARVSMAGQDAFVTLLGDAPVPWPGGRESVLQVEVRSDSFEDYVVYSANDSVLFDRREELSVHWYVSGGEVETTTQAIDSATRSAQTRWILPEDGTTVRIWVIVRDSRGGTSWAEFAIEPATATSAR